MPDGQPHIPAANTDFSSSYDRPSKFGFPKFSLIAAIVILIAIVIGGVVLVRSRSGKPAESPEPSAIIFTDFPSPTPESSAATEPVDKKTVKINIQNGTGIPREAAFLQSIMQNLGYTQIDVGNAENDDHKTTLVFFSDKIDEAARKELVEKLEDTYDDVSQSDKAPSDDYDIEIVTGTRPGVVKATPAAKATPQATPEVEGETTVEESPAPEESPEE